MTWTVGDFIVTQSGDQMIFSKDNRGNASMKALLFVLLASFCIFSLAIMSVISGGNADDVLSPKRNHVGFLWAILSLAMIVLLPWYLIRAYKPPLVFELHRQDRSVRSNGSIITRFEKIEYFQILSEADNDGRKVYRLVMFYGDGRELPIEKSYDGVGVRLLAREMTEFCGAKIRENAPMNLT